MRLVAEEDGPIKVRLAEHVEADTTVEVVGGLVRVAIRHGGVKLSALLDPADAKRFGVALATAALRAEGGKRVGTN